MHHACMFVMHTTHSHVYLAAMLHVYCASCCSADHRCGLCSSVNTGAVSPCTVTTCSIKTCTLSCPDNPNMPEQYKQCSWPGFVYGYNNNGGKLTPECTPGVSANACSMFVRDISSAPGANPPKLHCVNAMGRQPVPRVPCDNQCSSTTYCPVALVDMTGCTQKVCPSACVPRLPQGAKCRHLVLTGKPDTSSNAASFMTQTDFCRLFTHNGVTSGWCDMVNDKCL